jgi:hypothetical protein
VFGGCLCAIDGDLIIHKGVDGLLVVEVVDAAHQDGTVEK